MYVSGYVCLCSCHAVTDVLRGRALDDVIEDLPTVWQTAFRVRDDIKVWRCATVMTDGSN